MRCSFLLIFCVVTASFVSEVGLGVNTIDDPKTEHTGSSDALVVTVNSSSDIFLDGRRGDRRAVGSNLERARALNPKLAAVVKAYRQSTADTFVLVSEAARAANVAQCCYFRCDLSRASVASVARLVRKI